MQGFLLGLAIFVVFDTLPGQLASAAGLKTSANWTGGEVAQTISHGTFQTEIHRPVFDALIGEHKEGVVQVAWRPADGLPRRIDEEIDADADGQADFRVELDTAARQATLSPTRPSSSSCRVCMISTRRWPSAWRSRVHAGEKERRRWQA